MENGVLLSNIGAFLTLMLGVVAIFYPQKIQAFVSVSGIGKEGISEIRATYGGFFAGIAVFAIFAQSKEVFFTIGLGWLMASVVRAVTLFLGAFSIKNFGGVVFESAIGTLCSWQTIT